MFEQLLAEEMGTWLSEKELFVQTPEQEAVKKQEPRECGVLDIPTDMTLELSYLL